MQKLCVAFFREFCYKNFVKSGLLCGFCYRLCIREELSVFINIIFCCDGKSLEKVKYVLRIVKLALLTTNLFF